MKRKGIRTLPFLLLLLLLLLVILASMSNMIRSMVSSSSQANLRRERPSARGKNAIVMLSPLPTSATLADIRLLTYKPPKPTLTAPNRQASKPRDSGSSSLAASITKIEFVRTRMLNTSGRVAVHFRDKDRAEEFADTARDRVVGGNRIKAELTFQSHTASYPTLSLLNALQRQSPGRIVLIKGLPGHFTPGRLFKILNRSYQLVKEPVNRVDEYGKEQAIGPVFKLRDGQTNFSSFLVRFQTVSSAMMLIRRWHRTVFNSRDEEKFTASTEQGKVDENDEMDEKGLRVESRSRAGQSGERDTNSNWSPRGNDLQPEDELSRIVDAYLMY